MKSLEILVPPPAVMATAALAMWGIWWLTPGTQWPATLRVITGAVLAIVGVGFSIAGVRTFRRARTTINPMKPETASSLVTSGVYRVTRNPMYVGLALVLVAWAVFLGSAWALLGPVAFVLYIGRFQIAPEERALSALFGDEYAAYRANVRRWL